MRFPITLTISLLFSAIVSQSCVRKGCLDSEALNYDPSALAHDESRCVFETKSSTELIDAGEGLGSITLSGDKEYIVEGFVFVNPGQTLTIEAGAVLKFKQGNGADASALIVARGGKIMAEGTSENPIVFTSELDDLSVLDDLAHNSFGLWGGIIILGNAPINNNEGVARIPGIPTTENRGIYGGANPSDNSGVFRYVSIRYAGSDIGTRNEINGLSLGGVGNGTTIDHVEVIFSKNDGFEFFGGTVDAKYLVSAFCDDDLFEYTQGYQGRGQFWVGIQDEIEGDEGMECRGGDFPLGASPFSIPILQNITLIGKGSNPSKALMFRDNGAGKISNSIFYNFTHGIDIERSPLGQDTYARLSSGEFIVNNNVFYNVSDNNPAEIFYPFFSIGVSAADSIAVSTNLSAYFNDKANALTDPVFTVSSQADGTLDPMPGNMVILTSAIPSTDPWFTQTSYRGALSATSNWLKKWSFLDQAGYLK